MSLELQVGKRFAQFANQEAGQKLPQAFQAVKKNFEGIEGQLKLKTDVFGRQSLRYRADGHELQIPVPASKIDMTQWLSNAARQIKQFVANVKSVQEMAPPLSRVRYANGQFQLEVIDRKGGFDRFATPSLKEAKELAAGKKRSLKNDQVSLTPQPHEYDFGLPVSKQAKLPQGGVLLKHAKHKNQLVYYGPTSNGGIETKIYKSGTVLSPEPTYFGFRSVYPISAMQAAREDFKNFAR